MRGKVNFLEEQLDRIRITPAYAGKSNQNQLEEAHTQGSPPPMRGKVYDPLMANNICRITPAYAGKSRDFSERR